MATSGGKKTHVPQNAADSPGGPPSVVGFEGGGGVYIGAAARLDAFSWASGKSDVALHAPSLSGGLGVPPQIKFRGLF